MSRSKLLQPEQTVRPHRGSTPADSPVRQSAGPGNRDLLASLGEARTMPEPVQAKMEETLGADFSGVRLYESPVVAQNGAEAAASGNRVAFAPGKLNFGSSAGLELLGHELSHVASQARGEVSGSGFLNDPALERKADADGKKAASAVDSFSGGTITPMSGEPAPSLAGPVQAKLFKKPKKNGLISAQPDTSPESLAYMQAMRAREAELQEQHQAEIRNGRVNLVNSLPAQAARVGMGGGAVKAQEFQSSLLEKDENGNTFLDNSNQSLARGDRSGALVNLGIRTSQNVTAQADKAMRGSIFDNVGEDYTNLILNAQAGGLDTEAMLNDETVSSAIVPAADGRMEKLAYATGAGFDALNNRAMDIFSEYVLSDQSLEYISNFSQGVSEADVFKGNQYGTSGASGFALQTLVNTVGGNTNAAAVDKRLNPSSQRVAVNMGRTIGSLPKMANLPEESVPESLRPLRARYIQLQEELDRRLQERAVGRG